MELNSYRGVAWVRCGEPIPVSARVVSLEDEIAHREMHAAHAFAARCRLCESESVYIIKHVRRFFGEPRNRVSRRRWQREGRAFASLWGRQTPAEQNSPEQA